MHCEISVRKCLFKCLTGKLASWAMALRVVVVCGCLVCKLCLTLFVTPWTITHQAPSVRGISQARILEWVAISSSREPSCPRDWTCIRGIGRQVLYHSATWKSQGPGSPIRFSMFFIPALSRQNAVRDKDLPTVSADQSTFTHDTSRSRWCTSDAPEKSLGVRRNPRSQEAHKRREALNDGCSWVTRSHTFALLSVMGRMTIVEEISSTSLEASIHLPCALGTDRFRKILQGFL